MQVQDAQKTGHAAAQEQAAQLTDLTDSVGDVDAKAEAVAAQMRTAAFEWGDPFGIVNP